MLARRRRVVDDKIHQLIHADISQPRRKQYGKKFVFPYRLMHTVCGFYVTTAVVVLAVSEYYVRLDRFMEERRTMMKMALGLLTILVPLQMFIGDRHGENTLEHQPTKLAAIEGHWVTGSHVPLILFALPDDRAETNRVVIQVPDLGSLVLRHDVNGVVRGLKDWPRDQRPPVPIPFFAFRSLGDVVGERTLLRLFFEPRQVIGKA